MATDSTPIRTTSRKSRSEEWAWWEAYLAQLAEGCSDPLEPDEAWWQDYQRRSRDVPAWRSFGEEESATVER